MPVKDFIEELKRAMGPHFNNAEPPAIVTVTKVYSNSADVKYSFVDPETGETHNIIDRDVPILKPAYGNINVGDEVLLAFIGGNENNPIILGAVNSKFVESSGDSGRGIVSIDKVETDGLVDVYCITYDKEPIYSYFSVKNGSDGQKGDPGSGMPSALSGKTIPHKVLIGDPIIVTDVSSITIPNLNGDVDEEYILEIEGQFSTTNAHLRLLPNNISSNLKQIQQWTWFNIYNYGNGSTANTFIHLGSCDIDNTNRVRSTTKIFAKTGINRLIETRSSTYGTNSVAPILNDCVGVWNDITTNITNLVINVSAGTFSGTIRLYKMVDVTYPTN